MLCITGASTRPENSNYRTRPPLQEHHGRCFPRRYSMVTGTAFPSGCAGSQTQGSGRSSSRDFAVIDKNIANGQRNYSILYSSPGSTAVAYLTDDRLSVATNGDIFGTTFAGGDVGESSKCPEGVPGEAGCGVVLNGRRRKA